METDNIVLLFKNSCPIINATIGKSSKILDINEAGIVHRNNLVLKCLVQLSAKQTR